VSASAGLGCAIAIAILSLLPGDVRPHTASPKTAEHFAADLGAGLSLVVAASAVLRSRLGSGR